MIRVSAVLFDCLEHSPRRNVFPHVHVMAFQDIRSTQRMYYAHSWKVHFKICPPSRILFKQYSLARLLIWSVVTNSFCIWLIHYLLATLKPIASCVFSKFGLYKRVASKEPRIHFGRSALQNLSARLIE